MKTLIGKNDLHCIYAANGNAFVSIENLYLGKVYNLEAPSFEVEGTTLEGDCLKFIEVEDKRELHNGGTEVKLKFNYENVKDIYISVVLRYFPKSPFVRFKYELYALQPMVLTKSSGRDNIKYTGFETELSNSKITEVQFSHFATNVHSYLPNFDVKSAMELEGGLTFPGPIVISENDDYCSLIAYEHGAEYPDTYLSFELIKEAEKLKLTIKAEKGNYYNGEVINNEHNFVSPWFHFALCQGDREELLKHYREFFLKCMSENLESRKPYIFYNTWNYQERNRNFNGKKFLDSMNQERILSEIEIAHEMLIDVFVIDTGWFNKTGEWSVNLKRFPQGLKDVKVKLDEYGMKLGLWFNPTVAAKSSTICTAHPEYRMSIDGESWCDSVWETEESYGMCLASEYSDYFINKMIQLNKELGVVYFKWDGIGQYGCNSPLHNHGNENNTPEERLECYSYQMGLEMIRIVEEVSKVCPEVIVDFDVTEGGRFVGLGFLSVGKYFLVNNGPYAMDFDIPQDYKYLQHEPVKIDNWTNLFFYPGAARPRFCRQGIKYDSFIPSILFLTHYLPDAPAFAQSNSLASLVLGGNGIWGDLLALSEEDISNFKAALEKYKLVAVNVTESYPVVKGFIGSSPEIYEKIDKEASKGIICFFTKAGGTYTFITGRINNENLCYVEGADSYEVTEEGVIKITVKLNENDARIVFIY